MLRRNCAAYLTSTCFTGTVSHRPLVPSVPHGAWRSFAATSHDSNISAKDEDIGVTRGNEVEAPCQKAPSAAATAGKTASTEIDTVSRRSKSAEVEAYDPGKKIKTLMYDASLPDMSEKEKQKYIVSQFPYRTKTAKKLKAAHQKLYGSGNGSRQSDFVTATAMQRQADYELRLESVVNNYQQKTQNAKHQAQTGKGYRKKVMITPEMMGAPVGTGMNDPRLNGSGKYSANAFKSNTSRSIPLVHPKLAPGFYSKEFECHYNFQEEDVREHMARGSGPGGQATNRMANKCVLFHKPSRIQVQCHKFRSLWSNRKEARVLLNFKVENWMFKDESREAQFAAQTREEQRLLDADAAREQRLFQEKQALRWWKFRDFLEGRERIPCSVMGREGSGVMACLQECLYSRMSSLNATATPSTSESSRGDVPTNPSESKKSSSPSSPSYETNQTPLLGAEDFMNELTPAQWWKMLCGGKTTTQTLEGQDEGRYCQVYPNSAAATSAPSMREGSGSGEDQTMADSLTTQEEDPSSMPPVAAAPATPFSCVPVWFNFLFPCRKKPEGAQCCPDGLIKLLKARFQERRPVNLQSSMDDPNPFSPAPATNHPGPIDTRPTVSDAEGQDDTSSVSNAPGEASARSDGVSTPPEPSATSYPAPAPETGAEAAEEEDDDILDMEESEAGAIPNPSFQLQAYDDWHRRHTEQLLQELDATTAASLEKEIRDCQASEDAKKAVVKFFPLFLEMFGLKLVTKMVPKSPATQEEERVPSTEPSTKAGAPPGDEPKKVKKKKRVIVKRVVKKKVSASADTPKADTKPSLDSEQGTSSSSTGSDQEPPLIARLVIERDGYLWLEQRGRLMRDIQLHEQQHQESAAATPQSRGATAQEPNAMVVGLFMHLLCSLEDMGLQEEYHALRDFLYENSSLSPTTAATTSSTSATGSSSGPVGSTGGVLRDHRVPGGIRLPPWPHDFSDCVHMCLLVEERAGLV